MGPLGGALVGGTVGFIAGSFAGQVADDLEEKKQAATQAALGGGATVRWASQTNPNVTGYTEIVQTVTVPTTGPGSKPHISAPTGPYAGPVVYCRIDQSLPYRLEAPRCPSNGGTVQITEAQFIALTNPPPSRPQQATETRRKPSTKKRVETAVLPSEAPKALPASAPSVTEPEQMVCKTAKEVVQADGKEKVEMVEYCRAPGATGWVKKVA